MASSARRLIMFRSVTTSSLRCFTTVTYTAKTVVRKEKADTLFGKLSAVRDEEEEEETNITDILDDWVKEGRSIKRFDIIAYVNSLRRSKKYNRANQIYEWMEENKSQINNADHAIHIDLLAKTKGSASVANYFNSLQGSAKTKKTYGALLRCYCKEKMLDEASMLFEEMKGLDLTSTLNYNNMIALYTSICEPEKVILLAKEMEDKNIAADLHTYNQLMKSYASLKDLNAVEGVLGKMKTKNLKFDWFTFGNLAKIYANAGIVGKAHDALSEMEKFRNRRDRESFHTLIKLFCEISDLPGVNRSWDSLKSVFPKPSNVSYLIMLLALSKLGQVDALEKCFKEWESNCSNYDVRLGNVILESYLKRDMIEEAEVIYENIVKRGAEPNLTTFELLTGFYIKKRQIDLALKYLEKGTSKANPEKHKWFPTDETIGMFLSYFEEEDEVEKAEKFCKSLKMVDRLDSAVYDSLLSKNVSASKSVI